ncbi:MBL fold metallo-hydrolase [Paraconexibacter antarcticus]|uniref:MBL fold metallo-hydrolase n=1 Tax=Paraconexibacter antarcticus TaxID=2949664 RepID=A0ABY5DZG5_9ACTN|nr:MBL fold metallo-hydrolase [Paraconexibacter antarcticus]UTI66232.1 MBL fold metallo-hydrolase [Paraconexibacter antarcticus]
MTFQAADPPADVVRIAMPTPWAVGVVNAYLLLGEPLTLVDAGPRTPAALAALQAGAASVGIRLEDIELLVLTHQHQDHIGAAAELVRRSGARVAAFAPLAEELHDLPAALSRQHDYMSRVIVRHGMPSAEITARRRRQDSDRQYAESVAIDVRLRDGDVLQAGGRRLTVYHRPGHSPSDIILHDPGDGVLVVGDHLLPKVSSNPIAHLPLGARDVESAADERTRPRPLLDYLASLAGTRELTVSVALPGHGPVFSDLPTLIDARVAMHHQRAAEILAALQIEPRAARDLVDVLWTDLPPDLTYLAMTEVIAHLDLLGHQGAIVADAEAGVIRSRAACPRHAHPCK